jgi:hypothetical protein
MNKNRRICIVLLIFVSLSSYAVSADVLDAYIGKFMAKSGSMDDKLLGLLGDPSRQSKSSSGRTDKKGGSSTKSDTSDNSIKNVDMSDKTTDASKKKDAPIIEKTSSAALDKTKNLRKRLNDSSIMTLPAKGSSSINSQLQDVLRQLKSLKFGDETETVEEVELVQVAESEINQAIADSNSSEATDIVPPPQKIMTVKLPQDASQIIDVFELAESLFHVGDKVNALKYYRKSLATSLPVGKKANPKRAWVLFQIGNCLYNEDSVEAIKIYEQLILEHPSSDWTNCARTKKQVLKWLVVEKPMTLTTGGSK